MTINFQMSGGERRVGGTEGGGRDGTPLGSLLSHVLDLVGPFPPSVPNVRDRSRRERELEALRADPDLAYLANKHGFAPAAVLSMRRHYGRVVTLEAMRQMVGRPPHPAYLAAVCRRLAREGV